MGRSIKQYRYEKEKLKTRIECGFNQDRSIPTKKKHAFSKKDRLSKKQLMDTLNSELEADETS